MRTRPQPNPERGPPPPQIRNPNLSKIVQTNIRENTTAFWTRKKIVGVTILTFVVLAGIIIGLVANALDSRHITQLSNAPSPANPPTFASPTPSPPSSRPIPATLATAFRSSSWIWLGAQAATGVPGGAWAFQRTLPTSTASAREAIVLLTVDNGFELYHNGQFITENMAGWQTATAVHVNLDPNSNVFAILALNFPPLTNPTASTPAGLVASIQVSYADGTTAFVSSDATWRAAQPAPDGFQSLLANDTQWQSATEIAKYGSEPWGIQVVLPQNYNITVR